MTIQVYDSLVTLRLDKYGRAPTIFVLDILFMLDRSSMANCYSGFHTNQLASSTVTLEPVRSTCTRLPSAPLPVMMTLSGSYQLFSGLCS